MVSANEVVKVGPCAFALSLETEASPEEIWRLWADVENWKSFDTLLETSYLKNEATFDLGATGVVKANGAPKTNFKITELVEGVSFTEKLLLPVFHSLELKRHVAQKNQKTVFTHEVHFKGPMKLLLYWALADEFKKELPLVMGRLRDLAEKQQILELEEDLLDIKESN